MPPTTPAPHLIVPNFLNAQDHANLLRWTIEQQPLFVASRVHSGVDETFRRSQVLHNIGPFQMPFAVAARNAYKSWVQQMALPPFDVSGIELELAAHNDGAHFCRHIDTQTMMGQGSHRALSAVYYFYRDPKAFTGGQLRIYPSGTPGVGATSSEVDESIYADVEPTQNTLVVFPSWAAHQVMPVQCPSMNFADSRFAINCWLHVKTRTTS